MAQGNKEYGIVGCGQMGRNLARQALRKGMRVVGHVRSPDLKQLSTVGAVEYEAVSSRDMMRGRCFRSGDHIVKKTYMTPVEGENSRLRHYLARLHRKTFCYSKSEEMLRLSIKLLLHYLKYWSIPALS